MKSSSPEPNAPDSVMSSGPSVRRRPRRWGAWVLALLVCGGATPRSQAVSAYGIDGNGFLRQITNLSTMTSVVLGPTPFSYGANMGNVGLAINPAGQLYVGDNGGNLFTLSLTGVATPLGNPGLGPITGLDWDPVQNNLLVLATQPAPKFFHASAATGAQVGPVIPVAVPSGTVVESIAWLNPARAFMTYRDPGNTSTAVQLIGLGGGALIGTPAVSTSVNNWTGVDVDDSTGDNYLLGWLDDSWQVANSAGTLTATHLATGNHLDWTAFAIPLPESAPEPGTGLLIALGGAGVLLRRNRRRID